MSSRVNILYLGSIHHGLCDRCQHWKLCGNARCGNVWGPGWDAFDGLVCGDCLDKENETIWGLILEKARAA